MLVSQSSKIDTNSSAIYLILYPSGKMVSLNGTRRKKKTVLGVSEKGSFKTSLFSYTDWLEN